MLDIFICKPFLPVIRDNDMSTYLRVALHRSPCRADIVYACVADVALCFQIGGTYAKPVILPPSVAIGAIGKIQVRVSNLFVL